MLVCILNQLSAAVRVHCSLRNAAEMPAVNTLKLDADLKRSRKPEPESLAQNHGARSKITATPRTGRRPTTRPHVPSVLLSGPDGNCVDPNQHHA